MKRKKVTLRPLSTDIHDYYTAKELFLVCKKILFFPAKKMDIMLLSEALYGLDERPDEEIAPHRINVWKSLCKRVPTHVVKVKRKMVLMTAIIILMVSLLGCGLAWALHVGVLSFPSMMLLDVPQTTHPDAQSLIQSDLFYAKYPNSELRVREAAYDGHQLRIVYSLRDTRESATLTDDDRREPFVMGAWLDGIGMCDYLIVDGNDDIYLDEIFQRPSTEHPAQMDYYLTATLPKELFFSNTVTVEMPIGRYNAQTSTRMIENVCFPLDTNQANQHKRTAQKTFAVWGNLRIDVKRVELSPMHGLVEVEYSAVDADKPYEHVKLSLFDLSGTPVGHPRAYSVLGDTTIDGIITPYVPTGEWPQNMVLAPALADGSMDTSRVIPLTWEVQSDIVD